MDEKEAIKILNRRINQLRLKFAITNEDLEAIETVLNLLEKKDREIEKLKQSKIRQLERYKKYKENIDNQHEKIYEDLVEEIEFKDRIIDLITERFQQICVTPSLAKYQWKRICSEDLKKCEGRLCEDCIKQYFENKVTDTNVGERKVENGN